MHGGFGGGRMGFHGPCHVGYGGCLPHAAHMEFLAHEFRLHGGMPTGFGGFPGGQPGYPGASQQQGGAGGGLFSWIENFFGGIFGTIKEDAKYAYHEIENAASVKPPPTPDVKTVLRDPGQTPPSHN